MSKGSILATLVFMIILLVVVAYGIPYAIYAYMKSYARNDRSVEYAVHLFTTIVLISYFIYAAKYIFLILLFIIALLIGLSN